MEAVVRVEPIRVACALSGCPNLADPEKGAHCLACRSSHTTEVATLRQRIHTLEAEVETFWGVPSDAA